MHSFYKFRKLFDDEDHEELEAEELEAEELSQLPSNGNEFLNDDLASSSSSSTSSSRSSSSSDPTSPSSSSSTPEQLDLISHDISPHLAAQLTPQIPVTLIIAIFAFVRYSLFLIVNHVKNVYTFTDLSS